MKTYENDMKMNICLLSLEKIRYVTVFHTVSNTYKLDPW